MSQQLMNVLRQRYGADGEFEGAVWSDTLHVLVNHRSVRAYTAEPLPPGTLEALVAAAQSASTSSNLQAWSVVAIENPERKTRLAQLAGNQQHIRDCPLFLVWLADLARLANVAEGHALPHTGLDYLELFLLAAIDAALAAQNAVVAAESLGLGAVYIGGIRNQPLAVAEELRLPRRVFPVFGLCIGWPDGREAATIKPRLPQRAVLHQETYDLAGQDSAVADYNEVMATFYREQGMAGESSWARRSAQRVAGPHALSGRDTLRDTLARLGFPLR